MAGAFAPISQTQARATHLRVVLGRASPTLAQQQGARISPTPYAFAPQGSNAICLSAAIAQRRPVSSSMLQTPGNELRTPASASRRSALKSAASRGVGQDPRGLDAGERPRRTSR